MMPSKQTIEIQGSYGCGNFGDDALMVAAHRIVSEAFDPESIVVVSRYPGYIRRMIPGVRVESPDMLYRKTADVVLYGGGTQFYSFPLTSGKSLLVTQVARNLKRPVRLALKVVRKAIAKCMPPANPRLAAIGLGLGPFVENSKELRAAMARVPQMDYVAVRDVASYDLCRQWGCSNAALRSDPCYLPGLWQLPGGTVDVARGIRRVGVIPRDWPHTLEGDAYAESLFRVVDDLRSAGKEVEFISFAEDYDRKWMARLKGRSERVVAWNPEKDTITDFLRRLTEYDAFITARYHGAVFASILRKPTVCIGIEPKLDLVADLLGSGARLWGYPFEAAACMEQMASIEREYPACVERLSRVVEEQGALAAKMGGELKSVVCGL